MKKFTFFVGSFVLVMFMGILSHLLYLYTHCEFAPRDFHYNFTLEPKRQMVTPNASLKNEANEVLNQKFFYLGYGKQMTAFISEDQQHVIKFFNPRPVLKKKWFFDLKKLSHLCSLKWFSEAYMKRKIRLEKLARRYRIGFEELKEESGLIYVHLGPNSCLSRKLHLIDKEGKDHIVDLNSCPFVLQKKAELVTSYFDRLIQNGESEQVQSGITAVFHFFSSRAKKGFTDRIQTLHNNYGFTDGKVIQIDLGRIHKDEKIEQMPETEIEKIFSQIAQSLSRRYPQLQTFINTVSKKNLSQI